MRHLIESSKYEIMAQTDHSSIVDISRQKLITATTSTMKMNVRLIRASQFLSQFSLNIRHKPGHLNVIPDVLSRLPSSNIPSVGLDPDFNELDALYIYNTTLIEMDKSFAERITAGYDEDPVWRRTAKILVANEALGKNAATLSFERGQQHSSLPPSLAKKLIFHKDKFTGLRRLCIPQSCLTEIFELLHGKGDHPGFTRSFDLAQRSWSVKNLSKAPKSLH